MSDGAQERARDGGEFVPLSPQQLLLAVAMTWIVSSGATCMPPVAPPGPLAPTVFAAPPSLDELAAVMNSQSLHVRQLATDTATLSSGQLPSVRATIRLERPKRFRLQARLFGPALDFGSNDQLLWFWAKSNPDDAVFYVRHDEASRASGFPLPIEPEWLIDAFGFVELSPYDVHQGPYQQPTGNLEVQTRLVRPGGELIRTIVVHPTYGWVLEQRVTHADGRLLAAVTNSEHRYYPIEGISIPHRIQIELPPLQTSFQIEVAEYRINQIMEDPAELWTMPQYDGSAVIDLSQQMQNPAVGWQSSIRVPRGYERAGERAAYRPRIRGLPAVR